MNDLTRAARRGAALSFAMFVGLSALMAVGPVAPSGAASRAHRSLVAPHVGRALSPQAVTRLAHPTGERMHAGGLTDTASSTNWSGLVQEGSGIEGTYANWTVPSVLSSASALYSSSWVGVDGADNDDLIQTGTEQDTSDGYFAWVEILPADAVTITDGEGDPAVVEPGDQIEAYVQETATDTWTMFLQDTTEDWYFDESFYYYGPGASAEWIVEAPTIDGSQSELADFGSCSFTETAIYGDFGSAGTTWYDTDMNADNEVDMVNESDTVLLASPSAPVTDPTAGQDFVDSYDGSPIVATPTAYVTSPASAFQLTPLITIAYSASDPTSPITDYDVRYHEVAWNKKSFGGYDAPLNWNPTNAPQVTLTGVPGTEYCFDVRATSDAGGTSAWTPDSCTTLPLGVGSLRASPAHAWTHHAEPGTYLNSYDATSTKGGTLTLAGAWATQVAVVVTKCPTCGVLAVYVGGRLVRNIATHANKVERDEIYVTTKFTERHAVVVLKDASTKGEVIVNGVGIR